MSLVILRLKINLKKKKKKPIYIEDERKGKPSDQSAPQFFCHRGLVKWKTVFPLDQGWGWGATQSQDDSRASHLLCILFLLLLHQFHLRPSVIRSQRSGTPGLETTMQNQTEKAWDKRKFFNPQHSVMYTTIRNTLGRLKKLYHNLTVRLVWAQRSYTTILTKTIKTFHNLKILNMHIKRVKVNSMRKNYNFQAAI